MQGELGIWDKLTKAVLALVLTAVVIVIGYLCVPLYQQNERMRKLNLELEGQVQREEEAARQLKSSLEALNSDPKAIERLAREKLGYARPGETVIRFQEPATNAVRMP